MNKIKKQLMKCKATVTKQNIKIHEARREISDANDIIIELSEEITGKEAVIEYLEARLEMAQADLLSEQRFNFGIMMNDVKVRENGKRLI